MSYQVTVNYFDAKGNQVQKTLERKTIQALKNAIQKLSEKYEIYTIPSLSRNLYNDLDFNEFINEFGWN